LVTEDEALSTVSSTSDGGFGKSNASSLGIAHDLISFTLKASDVAISQADADGSVEEWPMRAKDDTKSAADTGGFAEESPTRPNVEAKSVVDADVSEDE